MSGLAAASTTRIFSVNLARLCNNPSSSPDASSLSRRPSVPMISWRTLRPSRTDRTIWRYSYSPPFPTLRFTRTNIQAGSPTETYMSRPNHRSIAKRLALHFQPKRTPHSRKSTTYGQKTAKNTPQLSKMSDAGTWDGPRIDKGNQRKTPPRNLGGEP